MANRVASDQMLHSVPSDVGLLCLLRPVCPNIYGKYVKIQSKLYSCMGWSGSSLVDIRGIIGRFPTVIDCHLDFSQVTH